MWPRTKSLIRRAWPNTAATLEVLAGAAGALIVGAVVALVVIAHVSIP